MINSIIIRNVIAPITIFYNIIRFPKAEQKLIVAMIHFHTNLLHNLSVHSNHFSSMTTNDTIGLVGGVVLCLKASTRCSQAFSTLTCIFAASLHSSFCLVCLVFVSKILQSVLLCLKLRFMRYGLLWKPTYSLLASTTFISVHQMYGKKHARRFLWRVFLNLTPVECWVHWFIVPLHNFKLTK